MASLLTASFDGEPFRSSLQHALGHRVDYVEILSMSELPQSTSARIRAAPSGITLFVKRVLASAMPKAKPLAALRRDLRSNRNEMRFYVDPFAERLIARGIRCVCTCALLPVCLAPLTWLSHHPLARSHTKCRIPHPYVVTAGDCDPFEVSRGFILDRTLDVVSDTHEPAAPRQHVTAHHTSQRLSSLEHEKELVRRERLS